MPTNDAIDKKLEDLDIVKAIENKDVPYVIVQIKQLINAARAEALIWVVGEGMKDVSEL